MRGVAAEMLELKTHCEACNRDLAPDAAGAFICSFECTFCDECTNGRFDRICPNCGGMLLARPPRPAALLDKYPPSSS